MEKLLEQKNVAAHRLLDEKVMARHTGQVVFNMKDGVICDAEVKNRIHF